MVAPTNYPTFCPPPPYNAPHGGWCGAEGETWVQGRRAALYARFPPPMFHEITVASFDLQQEYKLTSVGNETGILSEALDHAPAFSILMFTESARKMKQK